MRRRILLAALLMVPSILASQATSSAACATDSTLVTELRAFMNRHAFSGDHQTLDDVPDSTTSSGMGDRATIVRDEATCRLALQPYAEAVSTDAEPVSTIPAGVAVASVDNFYFVLAPDTAPGPQMVVVTDDQWKTFALFDLYGRTGG